MSASPPPPVDDDARTPARPALEDRAARPRRLVGRVLLTGWAVATVAGVVLLAFAAADAGPSWLSRLGVALVGIGYAVGLARRAGGRPTIALLVAVVICAAVLQWWGEIWLRNGAALLLTVVAALLAVLATRAARSLVAALREVAVAVALAGAGSLAVVALEPKVSLLRFEYAALIVALVAAIAVVYRLGAGLHGLGREGVALLAVLALLVAGVLLYGEAVRAYGSPSIEGGLADAGDWSRTHLGAFPRPLLALLGMPALVWGVHMRSRRPQGWWVTAFGVFATGSIALTLMRPRMPWHEACLSVLYGVAIGVLLGWLLIRLDLALTGGRGRRARRRAATALEPVEPGRTVSLR